MGNTNKEYSHHVRIRYWNIEITFIIECALVDDIVIAAEHKQDLKLNMSE